MPEGKGRVRVDYFEAVTHGASVYCAKPECLPKGVTKDSPEVSPVFAGSEWDHYPTCDTCGEEFDYVALTADGEAWLAKREGREAQHFFDSLDAFTKAYVEAALWSVSDQSTPAGGEPFDKNYGPGDFALEALQWAERVCKLFQTENADDLAATERDAGLNGHDFLLTRNGHGCGFWDGDLPEDLGRRLSDASHVYGECNVYIGDDDKLYFSEPYETLADCIAKLRSAGQTVVRHEGGRYFTVEGGDGARLSMLDVYALAARLDNPTPTA